MTVSELIDELQKRDPTDTILIYNREYGEAWDLEEITDTLPGESLPCSGVLLI